MSSSNDTNTSEDSLDSPDDPLVEIPRNGRTFELVKKSHITCENIKEMCIRCTSCLQQINHFDPDTCMKHVRLNVIVCKDCYDFYETCDFSKDDKGYYNHCTWCGKGGKLFLCDFCPNSFCSTCIRNNFGRAEVSKMFKDFRKCYVCEPEKLEPKVEFCELILNYSKHFKMKNETAEILTSKVCGPLSLTVTKDFVLPAFNELNNSCKSFHKRINKLKITIGSNQSISLNHVIKKMELVISQHKLELGQIIQTLSVRYAKYLDEKQKLEKPVSQKKRSVTFNLTNLEASKISMTTTSVSEDIVDENRYCLKSTILQNHLSVSSVSKSKNKAATKDMDNDDIVIYSKKESKGKVFKNAKSGLAKKDSKENFHEKSITQEVPITDADLQHQDLFKTKDAETKKTTTVKVSKVACRKEVPIDITNDPKLELGCSVVLQRCDNLVPNRRTTIPFREDSQLGVFNEESSDFCKSSPRTTDKKVEVSPIIRDRRKESKATSTKRKVSDSEDALKKKTTTKKAYQMESDSSDVVQPKKKNKFDKLPSERVLSSNDFSRGKDKGKKQTEKEKLTKQKYVSSKEEKNEKKNMNSDSVYTSTSESEEDKRKIKKKPKRTKKAASFRENKEVDDKDQKEGTSGKHRKNIKEIITRKNLAAETQKTLNAEKEQRRRVSQRQKMLPKIQGNNRKRCGECPGCLQKENCGSCAQCTCISRWRRPCRMRWCHFLKGKPIGPARKIRKRCGKCPGCLQKENCGFCTPCTNGRKWNRICKMRQCQSLKE